MTYQSVTQLQMYAMDRDFMSLRRELEEPTQTFNGTYTPLELLNVVSNQTTALGTAVLFEFLPAVFALIEHGANPDLHESIPPIMFAARIGHPEIVRQLLLAGADPNAVALYEWQEKQTALIWAVNNKQPTKWQIVLLLLKYGADPLQEDANGRSALSMAQERGDEMIVRMMNHALKARASGQMAFA
jgi:ankyrin repeat protein